MSVEEAITRITPMTNIGALTLNTANYKLQLRMSRAQWKQIYSTNPPYGSRCVARVTRLHKNYQYNKLHTEVTDLDTLRYVMNVLKDVREKESRPSRWRSLPSLICMRC